jgi:glycosyltransferase involved in cell wall biosynthesis
MPSRHEGFGLPILDAFACGVPVLTAGVSSMPEVAGDAALYCQPDVPASVAAGIAELLRPATAAELVQRGMRRLGAFSWERTAAAMCAVYERATCAGRAARQRSAVQRPEVAP